MFASNEVQVHTVEPVLHAVRFEKLPFRVRAKEHCMVASVVNKSERKAIEPDEQIKVDLK